MIVISTGCPAGIGPEISVKAAAEAKFACLLVGDFATLKAASKLVGVDPKRLVRWAQKPLKPKQIPVLQAGPKLAPIDRVGGKPSKIS